MSDSKILLLWGTRTTLGDCKHDATSESRYLPRFCVWHWIVRLHGRLKHAGDFSSQWTAMLPMLFVHGWSQLPTSQAQALTAHPAATLPRPLLCKSHTVGLTGTRQQMQLNISLHDISQVAKKNTSSYQQNIKIAGDFCRS